MANSDVWGAWGFAHLSWPAPPEPPQPLLCPGRASRLPHQRVSQAPCPAPSWQKVADLLQPGPQGHLARGHLRAARSEKDILRELPQGPRSSQNARSACAPQVLGGPTPGLCPSPCPRPRRLLERSVRVTLPPQSLCPDALAVTVVEELAASFPAPHVPGGPAAGLTWPILQGSQGHPPDPSPRGRSSRHPRSGPGLGAEEGEACPDSHGASQVHVAVGHSKVRLYVDCRKVAERPAGEAGDLPAEGFVTLGRLAKARGPRSSSASVSTDLVLRSQTNPGRRSPFQPLPQLPWQPCSSLSVVPAPDATDCLQ